MSDIDYFVEQVRNEDDDERRERMIRAHEQLSGEEIIRVENMDTGEYDYTPIWLSNPSLIVSALAKECEQASIIDESQYMSEVI